MVECCLTSNQWDISAVAEQTTLYLASEDRSC